MAETARLGRADDAAGTVGRLGDGAMVWLGGMVPRGRRGGEDAMVVCSG